MDGYWAWGVPAGLLVAGLYALGRIGTRENVAQWGHGLTNRIDGLVRVFVRRFHRFQYDPIPYPQNGGALLASNHVSGLDPMLLTSACTRPLRFMVATEQFHRFGLEWLYRLLRQPSRAGRMIKLPVFVGLVLREWFVTLLQIE